MQRPLIGIFIKKDAVRPVFKDGHYEQAYNEIIEAFARHGASAVLLVNQNTYKGNGVFESAWEPAGQGKGYSYHKLGPTAVDIIFDKDYFEHDETVPVFNPTALKEICHDKHLSYEVLEGFHSKSWIVHDEAECRQALKGLPGDVVVIKGLLGHSGQEVFVGAKEDAMAEMRHVAYPYQVQEFIETGGGIPGITSGRHDLRLLMMGNEPILATLRTPPEGGYKSNLGYGGVNRLVALNELPDELFGVAAKIDAVLKPYAPYRLYSADFGLTPQGWKLFEINGWPGVITKARGEELARVYQEKITRYIIDMYNFYVKVNNNSMTNNLHDSIE